MAPKKQRYSIPKWKLTVEASSPAEAKIKGRELLRQKNPKLAAQFDKLESDKLAQGTTDAEKAMSHFEITITDEVIKKHPELKKQGFKVGETIRIENEDETKWVGTSIPNPNA